MRQPEVIAAVLADTASLVIAEEPTASLDAKVLTEIPSLPMALREQIGCGVIFINHDMAVVARIAQRISVMTSTLLAALSRDRCRP